MHSRGDKHQLVKRKGRGCDCSEVKCNMCARWCIRDEQSWGVNDEWVLAGLLVLAGCCCSSAGRAPGRPVREAGLIARAEARRGILGTGGFVARRQEGKDVEHRADDAWSRQSRASELRAT